MSMIQSLQDKLLKASVCLTEFKKNEKGVTAVEYAVVVAGVTILVIAVFAKNGIVANMLNSVFSGLSTEIVKAVNKSV